MNQNDFRLMNQNDFLRIGHKPITVSGEAVYEISKTTLDH